MSDPGQTHYVGDGCEPAHELAQTKLAPGGRTVVSNEARGVDVEVAGLREALAEREADCRRAEARLAVAAKMAKWMRSVRPHLAYDRRRTIATLLAEWDALNKETTG